LSVPLQSACCCTPYCITEKHGDNLADGREKVKKHQKVLCVVAFGISAGMASAAQVLSADELRQAVSGKVVGDGQHWTYHLKKMAVWKALRCADL
jgi:hypothetical protein